MANLGKFWDKTVKESQKKHSRWLYGVLVLMLLALLGFSTFPVFSSIISQNQSLTKQASASRAVLPPDQQARLETEALGYQLVLQREPENQTALRGLLEIRLQQGDIAAAMEPLAQLAQLNPQQVDYTLLLAEGKAYLGDSNGAAEAYGTILASQPGNISALQGRVNLHLQQERPQEAIALLKQTLNQSARLNAAQSQAVDVVGVQLLLGQVYLSQKSYPEAIAVYEQAAETDPQDFRPLLAKALVLQEQGQEAEARSLFTAAAALAPSPYQEQITARANANIKLE